MTIKDFLILANRFRSTPIVDDDFPEIRDRFDHALQRISEANLLTFDEFSSTNHERALLWHKGGLEEWSIADWAVATAGECGEICDAVKKLRRVEEGVNSNNPRQPADRDAAMAEIKKEIGDTAVYLDLLAQRCGFSLEDCIREVFNKISEREGMPQRL